MAKQLRIDTVTPIAGGGFNIGYTASSGALPASPSKNGLSFRSKAHLIAEIQRLEDTMSEESLLLIGLAIAYKADNSLNNAASVIGKTIAMSLTSGAQLVKVLP